MPRISPRRCSRRGSSKALSFMRLKDGPPDYPSALGGPPQASSRTAARLGDRQRPSHAHRTMGDAPERDRAGGVEEDDKLRRCPGEEFVAVRLTIDLVRERMDGRVLVRYDDGGDR